MRFQKFLFNTRTAIVFAASFGCSSQPSTSIPNAAVSATGGAASTNTIDAGTGGEASALLAEAGGHPPLSTDSVPTGGAVASGGISGSATDYPQGSGGNPTGGGVGAPGSGGLFVSGGADGGWLGGASGTVIAGGTAAVASSAAEPVGGTPALGGSAGVTGAGGNISWVVSGVVQKGPFVLGTTITLQELDGNLNPTGRAFSTQTDDELGHFEVPINVTSRFVEVIANGYFFDELTNQLSGSQLILRALSDLASSDLVNVNLLTTLAATRERNLVAGGQSFSLARGQAEQEVLAALSATASASKAFDQLDISQSGESNGQLLASSVLLEALANVREPSSPVARLSELLASIAADIAPDGKYDDTTTASTLRCVIPSQIDKRAVRDNLERRFASLGAAAIVPAFEPFVFVPSDCCKMDSKRCNGTEVQSCDELGRWSKFAACSGTTPICKDGRCEPPCASGDNRCSGEVAQVCDALGSWQDNGHCSWGQPIALHTGTPAGPPLPMVVDSNRIVTVAWTQFIPGSDILATDVWAARFVPESGWSRPERLTDESGTESQLSAFATGMAVAANDEVTVGWVQSYYPGPSIRSCLRTHVPGSGWESEPQVVESTPETVATLVGYSGTTAVALFARAGGLTWSERTLPAAWTTPQAVPTLPYPILQSLARPVASSSGVLAFAWSQVDSGEKSFTDVRLYKPMTGWTAPQVFSPATNPPIQLTINSSNDLLVLAQDQAQHVGQVNWFARYTDVSGWTNNMGIPDAHSSLSTLGLVSDSDGNAMALQAGCVGMCFALQVLGRRYDAKAGWREPVRIDSSNWSFNSGNIAIDPIGNIIAVWEQFNSASSITEIWINRYKYDLGWGTPERLRSVPLGNYQFLQPLVTIDNKGRATLMWQEAGTGLIAARFE